MAAYSLAIVLLAATLAPASYAQGYGGVPQGVKGRRTTTTFAPDVIPSDQQAFNFNQQNPNPTPSPAHNQPGPSYNQPGPSYNQPGPAHNQQGPNNNQQGPAHNQQGPAHNQQGPAHNQQGPTHNQQGPAHNQPGPGQGPLKDNNIGGYPSGSPNEGALPSGGDFWWMNSDNPFKGAGVPEPQPGSGPSHNQGGPNPGCGAGQPCGQPNKPTGQYPSGNQPSGSSPGQGCQAGQNCGGAINPNNPFIQGGKPAGGSSYPQVGGSCQPGQNCGQPGKPSSSYPGPNQGAPAISPGNPFINNGGQSPSGSSTYPNQQKPTPVHAGINPNNPFLSGVGGPNNGPQGGPSPYPGANQGGNTVTCAGAGYLCVPKYTCENGVVVDKGEGLPQIRPGAQKCDTASQACCRLPSSPPSGGGYGPNSPIKNTNTGYPSYQGKNSSPGLNGIPIGGSIYDGPTANPNVSPYTGPLNTTPYPGCAAALKCVELIYCTAEGVMSDSPVSLTREQSENRVPLSECSNPDTGILGKCCRDPNYKDPWPGGMMMPGGPGPVDQAGFPTGQYVDHVNHAEPSSPSQQHQFNQQLSGGSTGPLITNPAPQKPAPGYQPGPNPLPQRPQTQPTYQQPQQTNYPQQTQQPQQPNFPQQQQKPNFGQQTNYPQQTQQPQQQQKPNFPQQTQQPQQSNFPQQQQNTNFGQQTNYPQEKPGFSQQQPNPQQQKPGFPQQPNFPQQQTNFPKPVVPVQKPVGSQPPRQHYPEPEQYQPQPGAVNFASQKPVGQAGPKPGAECGLKRNVDRSGLSAIECGFGEFPWHVVVMSSTTRQPLCSGALISDRAVVTAANCVKNVDSADILIEAGLNKLGHSSSAPRPSQSSPVAAIARHPNFEEGSLFNDMAVLLLAGPLQLDQHIDTICLPQGQASTQNCVATGFGKQALQGNVAGSLLHQIAVNIIPSNVCEEKLKRTNLGQYFVLNKSFQCAVPTVPEHDLCKVDAGGPIACDRGDGHHELTGLYSWDVGCNTPTNPTALASVDTAWINSVLQRPVDEILRDELNEVERKKNLQQVVDGEEKPGFSQGYGKK